MKRIDKDTALRLLKNSDILDLGEKADNIRKTLHPKAVVTFIVDRNINYTNVCINKCRFCAFYRDAESPDAYLLGKDEIFKKIDETIALGGTQILLQGGIHPELEMDYYIDLLKSIKDRYSINLHGFSPPEISYLADKHDLTIRETLVILRQSGLDSIPGGGAEILSDRVREILSPKKIKSSTWLKVMEEAHNIGMRTTATMMFGSVEEPEDIIEHLDAVRNLQDKTGGFTAFIPWSFQPGNTELIRNSEFGIRNSATAVDYLRALAVSRIYFDNIKNIQASWVTQGLKLAQVALRFGANDFGSTMIEENVVRAAGVNFCVSKEDIIQAIKSAGFKAAQRDTYYNIIADI
ncbi:MAG: cyclic dehypoxanthinyl futalosine synthase [Thermodesulfovibrionales bacterium]|nr:cyclic dehypoxanthinyl futalosine synthase [Thermodesulfovibrionales bacterium]